MPGMTMPGMTMPTSKKKPAVKKPRAKKAGGQNSVAKKPTAAARKPSAKPTPRKAPAARSRTASDPHAGHNMSQPQQPSPMADTHAGHDMSTMPQQPSSAADPHAGHDMSTMPTGSVSGHDMTAMSAAPSGTDLPAGNAPPPPAPTANAADAVYGSPAMGMGRHHLVKYHGGQRFFQALLNVAELQWRQGRPAYEWDGEAWYGGDINRLWLKSEGEGEFGRSIEKVQLQALYSRAIDPYWNVQGGIRTDFKPNPSRAYATIGVEGLAPSFFDVEAALFLSNKGELLAKLEGYYDQRITQRLILQPRAELNFAAQDTRELKTGAGLSDGELGLRLRYDIRREFAPYVGVQYRRAFGNTRHFLRDEGEGASSWSVLTGIRMWF